MLRRVPVPRVQQYSQSEVVLLEVTEEDLAERQRQRCSDAWEGEQGVGICEVRGMSCAGVLWF